MPSHVAREALQIFQGDGFWTESLETKRHKIQIHRHFHDVLEVAVGVGSLWKQWLNGSSYYSSDNTVIAHAPGELHAAECCHLNSASQTYKAMYIEIARLKKAAEQMELPGLELSFSEPVIVDDELAKCFQTLHRAMTLEHELSVEWLLLRFTEKLAGHSPNRPKIGSQSEQSLAYRVRDILHACPDRKISLDELGRLVNRSPFRVAHSFKSHFGLPPHRYHLNLRLEKAWRSLLAQTPIIEVAQTFGFTDQSHLSRHFQRYRGWTPGAYLPNRQQQERTRLSIGLHP